MSPLRSAVRGGAAALALALVACAPDAGQVPTDRYISVFNAPERSWQRESELGPPPDRDVMVMYEVSAYPPGDAATPAQREAAAALVERCLRAAERRGWFEFEKASEDGYELVFGDKTHYAKRDYVLDDRILDPERPEVLMYANTRAGRRLTGFMFYAREPREWGPQPGGALTVWHYHTWPEPFCLLGGLLPVGRPDRDGRCAAGEPARRSPEMLHVWLLEHPYGRFATRMSIPQRLLLDLLAARERELGARSF